MSAEAVLGYIIVSVVTGIISSGIQSMSYGDPKRIAYNREMSGIKSNTKSTKEPLKIIYGMQRIGGNDVYGTTLGHHNKDLYLVQTLSEGVCEGIYNSQIFIDDKIYTEFGDTVEYTFHDGSPTQTVDSTLHSADSNWTDPLRNTCYIMWKFTWDEDKYRNIPYREVILKGIKVYDFRDGTTGWSDNPVLCLYDFFTNERYGLGISSDKIDKTTWTNAANYCDTKGWKCNYVVNVASQNTWQILENFMNLFRGTITWFDGKFYLYYADLNQESSVMTIKDEHIVQGEDGKSLINLIQPSQFEKPDGLKVTFIDKDKQYTEDSVVLGENEGIIEEFYLPGCTDRVLASKLGLSYLERMKYNRIITGTFRDDCINLSPHDIITLNSTSLAISDQKMRVVESVILPNGLVNLTLQYESEDIYDDDYDSAIEDTYSVDLPDPNEQVYISSPSVTEDVYYYRLRTFIKLNVSFTVPENEPWFKHVEAYVSTEGAEDSKYQMIGKYTSSFEIDPVEEGQEYWIKLVVVSIWGVKTPFADADKLYRKVTGISNTPPESLSYLTIIPGDNSIRLLSDKLDDPDIEIYEFRLGSQWSGGVFLASKRSPNETIMNIKPGTHTFTCNTKSTNGLYGTHPVSATVTVQKPKGWSDYTTFTDDYISSPTGRIFVNTEHYTYNSDDWLKCSHDSTNYSDSTAVTSFLQGKYWSREFDTGVAAQNYYVYFEADVTTIGAGTTWDDVLNGGTWDDIQTSSRTWNEIFELEEAPKINVKIYWKEESTHDWSVIEHAEVLAGVVKARYFKVYIEIEDPSDAVNLLVENFTLHLLN